jgi:RNA polymerase sigma-70 factor (ECF subfamily)
VRARPTTDLDLRSPASRIIIGRAQTGDLQALDTVLRALQEPLYAHVRAILHDDDRARDALQDTLLAIARKLSQLQEPAWLRAWAYRIATRQAVRHGNLAKRWVSASDPDAIDARQTDGSDEPRYDRELIEQIPTLVDRLPAASQAIVRMHYLQEMTYVEIAEALEISVGTVKSRLAYGLQALRKRLGVAAT